MRRRWLLLLLALPLYALILSLLAVAASTILFEPLDGWRTCALAIFHPEPLRLIDAFTDPIYWAYFGGPAVLVALTQLAFLLPVTSFRTKKGEQGKSLWLSFVMAGLVGSGMATTLFLALMEVWLLIKGDSLALPEIGNGVAPYFGWLAAPLLLSWIAWTFLIGSFAQRNRHPMILRKLLGWLLAGTVIEVLIVLPLDIMVRRKTNCYCETATAHALGISIWGCLWLAGPGAVLAVLSKRRRLWWDTHCSACGYEKGPSPGPICPECGFHWIEVPRNPPQTI